MIYCHTVLFSEFRIHKITCMYSSVLRCRSEVAGWATYARYTNIIFDDNIPFVRSSGSTRVVDSARNWTLGERLSFLLTVRLIYLLSRLFSRQQSCI